VSCAEETVSWPVASPVADEVPDAPATAAPPASWEPSWAEVPDVVLEAVCPPDVTPGDAAAGGADTVGSVPPPTGVSGVAVLGAETSTGVETFVPSETRVVVVEAAATVEPVDDVTADGSEEETADVSGEVFAVVFWVVFWEVESAGVVAVEPAVDVEADAVEPMVDVEADAVEPAVDVEVEALASVVEVGAGAFGSVVEAGSVAVIETAASILSGAACVGLPESNDTGVPGGIVLTGAGVGSAGAGLAGAAGAALEPAGAVLDAAEAEAAGAGVPGAAGVELEPAGAVPDAAEAAGACAAAAGDARATAGGEPTMSVTWGTCANGSSGACVEPAEPSVAVGSWCLSVITFGGAIDGAAAPLLTGCFAGGGSFGGAWSFGTESVGKPTRGSPTTGSWGTGAATAGYRKAE